MIRYRCRGDGETRPERVECDPVGYPHTDADGFTQYDNSHFDTEAAAWDSLLKNRAAGVRLSAMMFHEAEQRLADARERLARAALLRDQTERNHEEWLRLDPDDVERVR